MSKYPTNYDFGANWEYVLSFLENRDEVDKIIKKCHKMMKKEGKIITDYDKNKAPPDLLTINDAYYTLIYDMVENILDNYDEDYMTKKEIAIMKKWKTLDEDDSENDEYNDKRANIENKIINRLGYNFASNRDKLAFYVPFGTCHWWNKTFSLWLAKKMFPSYKWVIREGDKHTTVYCEKHNMIFDIIYWATDNRLEDYINGLEYSSDDKTLGGGKAYRSSI